jgi:rare lipoprotein A
MKISLLLAVLLASMTIAAQTSQSQPLPTSKSIAAAPAPAPAASSVSANASKGDQMQGLAAYYSNRFNGRLTANGQRFSNDEMTAAHNSLPFGTRVKITNVKNKSSVIVRINDRGPATPGRVFDLTRAAASKLGYLRKGVAKVTAEIISDEPAKVHAN